MLPASARAVVDKARFGRLTALDTRREVYGRERRAILTHSPELHAAQAAGFTGTTLAKAGRRLDELAATLARGKTRRPRAKVEAEIGKILHDTWARRVIAWQLTGDTPREHRLSWHADKDARAALEEEIFGRLAHRRAPSSATARSAGRPKPAPRMTRGRQAPCRIATPRGKRPMMRCAPA